MRNTIMLCSNKMKNFDKFIVKFSKDITKLRQFEKNVTVTDEHTTLFDKLLYQLLKRKEFALDQDCWEELYKRSLYFYKYIDNIQGIPCVFVTKHNDIVPWYCSQTIHNYKGTIVHYDGHSDMNPIEKNRYLPRLYEEYLKGDESRLQEISEIVWDIGAANSGLIYTTGPRDYVWCMPVWLPDKTVSFEYYLKGTRERRMVSDDKRAKDKTSDIEYTSKLKKDVPFVYTKVQTGTLRKDNLRMLRDAVRVNGNEYILDIDLDYIVCNGKELNKAAYFKEPYDVRSHKRTGKVEYNEDVPREKLFESTELRRYKRHLNLEKKEIDKRIRDFLRIIRYLKKCGLTPSHISVCDSTNIQFQDCNTCNSVSNGYVPTHLALYVHTKVVHGLQKALKSKQ